MRAAVYYENGGPSVLVYEEIADPVLRPKSVLIGVEAISIEGGDTLNRLGGVLATTPHVVGYQCGGTIVAVGDEVTDRHVGQRVVASMAFGSHAELAAVPVGSTWLVPDGLDLLMAACVPIAFGTADDCLFEFGHLVAGESVLIQAGASGVGIAAIQLAHRAGATVLATASSSEKLERLTELGLDHGINYVETDFADEAHRLTGGRGVDLVVDSVGSTLPGSIASLAYRGRISYVGNAGRDAKPVDVSSLMLGNQSLNGVFLGAELARGDRAHANIQRLLGEVAAGELRMIIDRTFPLAEAAAAHAYLEQRRAFAGSRSSLTPSGVASVVPPRGRKEIAMSTDPEQRIAPLDAAELDEEQRALIATTAPGPAGTADHIYRTLVRHPGLFRKWLPFAGKLLSGKLAARERELLILRTGWRCQAPYEWGQHVIIGREAGLRDEEIQRVKAGPDDPGWSADDATLLLAADELHDTSRLSDKTWAALTANYDEKQIVEILMVVGHYHMVSFVLNGLGVQREPGVPGFD